MALHGRPKKYLDFVEGAPVNEHSHRGICSGKKEYIPITCPHCSTVFVKIPSERLHSNKASQCLKHIRVCPKFQDSVKPAPKTSKIDRMEEELAEFRAAQACMQSNIARMWEMLGGGEPKPTSLIELSARAPEQIRQIEKKRKFDDSALEGWEKRSEKGLLIWCHPDKDSMYCKKANEFRSDLLQRYLNVNKRGRR